MLEKENRVNECKRTKKIVYYIGFYDGKYCHRRGNTEQNLAGSMKMDFVIQSLKNWDIRL